MGRKSNPRCAQCPIMVCQAAVKADETPPLEKAPEFCPMVSMPGAIEKAMAEYERPQIREFARQASVQEFECYEDTPQGRRTRNPRILELIQFTRKCGYKRLGLAFCGGLGTEAQVLTRILESHGFDVVSVRCKVGAVPKERIGVKPEQKIAGAASYEPMCNPIAQAEVLNAAGVDFAIMLGLCIGHDTLFIKYCRVPMTVIAVKDRVTGHNPLAPLYTMETYYRSLMAQFESKG